MPMLPNYYNIPQTYFQQPLQRTMQAIGSPNYNRFRDPFPPQQPYNYGQQQQQQPGGANPMALKSLWAKPAAGAATAELGGSAAAAAPEIGGEAAPLGLTGSYAGAEAPAAFSGLGEGIGGAAGAGEGISGAGAGIGEGIAGLGTGISEGLAGLGGGISEGLGSLFASGAGEGAAAAGAGEGLATFGTALMEAFPAFFAMFSDERLKENKQRAGELYDGTPVWAYNYIGDPTPRIGLMAQEVEQIRPDAVFDIGGVKAVRYDKATERARHIGGILGDFGQ